MRPDLAPSHADRQSAIAAALLNSGSPLPGGLLAPCGGPIGRRFAVHRASATLGSIAALATRHPVLERLLGTETFADLARAFLGVDRPRTALLLEWGDALPDFVAAHPDLADWPWLADVARLERAWAEAHHAADAEPMRLADLVDRAPEELVEARLRLHPSLRLLVSPWSVAAVWAAGGEVDHVDAAADRIMVLRPGADVGVHRLDATAFAFVSTLAEGETVTVAATAASRLDDAFDAGAHLVDLVRMGVVVAIEDPDHRENPT